MKHLPLAGILFFFLTGCGQSATEGTSNEKNELGSAKSHSIPDGEVIYRYFGGDLPEEIYMVNKGGDRQGYSFHYHENGALIRLSTWENGVKEGRELIFFPSGKIAGIYPYQNGRSHGDVLLFENFTSLEGIKSLRSHQLFREGIKIYEGLYHETEKHRNKLYPHFVEEFFFEDKYYAKVKFLLDYAGQMEVRVKIRGNPVIEYLGDNTFQLVINDALDLNGYELELSYQPAVRDTLVAFSYVYPHIIYVIE